MTLDALSLFERAAAAIAERDDAAAERVRMGGAIAFISPRAAVEYQRAARRGDHGQRAMWMATWFSPVLQAALVGVSQASNGVIVNHDPGDEHPTPARHPYAFSKPIVPRSAWRR